MKKAIKITGSIFLTLALIICSMAVTVQYAKRSMYFYDIYQLFPDSDAVDVLFNKCSPWDYYSKYPDDASCYGIYTPTLDEVLKDMGKTSYGSSVERCVMRCTFENKKNNKDSDKRTELVFAVNEVLLGKYPYQKVRLYFERKEMSYYTEIEQMLNYFGVGYEEDEEYLLFLRIDDSYNAYIQGTEKVVVGQTPSAAGNKMMDITKLVSPAYHFITKLSGEYPYIEFYPSLGRYDARDFGSHTKYVTADDFVLLVTQAIENAR